MSLPPEVPGESASPPAAPVAAPAPPAPVPEPLAPAALGDSPAAPRRPFPGFWGGVLLIVLVQILANVMAGFVIVAYVIAKQIPLESLGTRMPGFASIGIVANTLGFLPVVYFAWRRSGLPASTVFPLRPVSYRFWLPILLMLAGGYVVAEETTNLLYRLWPPPDLFKELMTQLVGKGTGFASLFFLAVVAPVTEELLFRGVILTGFLRRYKVFGAMAGSAFLFGVIHLDPWQLVPAMILGLLFALWRVQTGSLWPALLAHAATNGIAFQQGLSQDPADIFKPQTTPLWVLALGVGLLLVGLQWGFAARRQQDSLAAAGEFK